LVFHLTCAFLTCVTVSVARGRVCTTCLGDERVCILCTAYFIRYGIQNKRHYLRLQL